MSGPSSQPPWWTAPRQPGSGPSSDQSGDPVAQLPAAPERLALPAPHPGELALPPGTTPAALPPAPAPLALPPAPSVPWEASGSVTAPTDKQLPSPPPASPEARMRRWASGILAAAATLLVVCMLPLWTFGLWSLWVTNSHQPPPVLATLDPGGQRADDVRWSPDGRYLTEQITLAGARPGDPRGAVIVLWDVAGQRAIRSFTRSDGGLAAAWSPNGDVLATTDGAHVLLWSTQQIEVPGANVKPVTLTSHDPSAQITDLAWSKDGLTLAAADEGGLDIWTTSSTNLKPTRYFSDSRCATTSCGRRLSWSPDGRWLLVAPWHAKGQSGVGVWDTQTWKQAPLLNASAPLAWSPDGTLALVRASDETTLAALQAGSWSVAWTIDPNRDLRQTYNVYPQAAGWSPDGRWLVGGADGWVDLWPTDTRQSIWVWNEQQADQGIYAVSSLSWSPDSHTLAVTTDGTARLILYDLRDPSPP